MAEFDIRKALFNRDFMQGFLNKRVVKGLNMTPLLQKQELDDDTFTWLEEAPSAEQQIKDGLLHDPRILTEGAKIEEVRLEGISSKTGTVEKRGFKITISNNLLKRSPTVARSVFNRMENLSYALGRWIESEVYTAVKAAAIRGGVNAPEARALVGANGEVEKALLDYGLAYDLDEYSQELDTLIYNKYDLAGVREQLNANEVVTQNRGDIIKGWDQGRSFEYMGISHMRGNMFQTQNEIFGFDRNVKFGTVFYGVEEGAYNPEVKTGMEAFAPLINVTVQKPQSWEIPKETTIRMLASVGVAIDKERAILYDNAIDVDTTT